MEGEKLLNSLIGKSLLKGKIQSFILEGEMSDLINVTFLYFDTWIRIVSTDEITSIIKETNRLGVEISEEIVGMLPQNVIQYATNLEEEINGKNT